MTSTLPKAWTESTFGSLNNFSSKTISPQSHPLEEFELYSVPAFPSGEPEICQGKDIGSTKQIVHENSILVCKINPRINRVWEVSPSSGARQIASSEWIGFWNEGLNARFYQYYFRSSKFRSALCADVTGVGGSLTRAQPKKAATIAVPVAPINEQRRIADKLDRVLARIDSANEHLSRVAPLIKRFRQSVLSAATSGRLTRDLYPDNRNYERLPLGKLASTRLGKMLDKKKNTGALVKYIRNVNVRWFSFDLSDLLSIRIEPHEVQSLAIQDGDVLICEGGEPGRCSVWREGPTDLVFQKAIHRARVDSKRLLPEWLAFCLKHQSNTGEIEDFFTGTTIKHLTGVSLAKLLIPVPPIDEQSEIVRRVEKLFAFADRLEERLTQAQAAVQKLTPALLAKAFRGELVPQDPNDEPASELLKRLQESRVPPSRGSHHDHQTGLQSRGRQP